VNFSEKAIYGLQVCGIIPFKSLVLGEDYFISDKSNGIEDHPTPKVSKRTEPDAAANVESS
jgi:hypothetical protein